MLIIILLIVIAFLFILGYSNKFNSKRADELQEKLELTRDLFNLITSYEKMIPYSVKELEREIDHLKLIEKLKKHEL